MSPIAAKVAEIFAANFSFEPAIYFSPGRINLIGEHVDYNDGFVMPAAIDKGIYYAIVANGTDTIQFHAADLVEHFSVDITDIKKKMAGRIMFSVSSMNLYYLEKI